MFQVHVIDLTICYPRETHFKKKDRSKKKKVNHADSNSKKNGAAIFILNVVFRTGNIIESKKDKTHQEDIAI